LAAVLSDQFYFLRFCQRSEELPGVGTLIESVLTLVI